MLFFADIYYEVIGVKIEPNKVAGIYEANKIINTSKTDNGIKNQTKSSVDRIEISKAGAKYNEISALKSKLIGDIDKGSSTEKLQRLKFEINNGTYHISSDDIAGAMFKMNSGG